MRALLRNKRFRLAIGVAIVLLAAITVFFGGPLLSYGRRIYEQNFAAGDMPVEARTASLAESPEPLPNGLRISPPPGSVVAGVNSCVSMDYVVCRDSPVVQEIKDWLGLCNETFHDLTIDGKSTPFVPISSMTLKTVNGQWISDMQICISAPVGTGQHLLTVTASPLGQRVTYSWVWVVE